MLLIDAIIKPNSENKFQTCFLTHWLEEGGVQNKPRFVSFCVRLVITETLFNSNEKIVHL